MMKIRNLRLLCGIGLRVSGTHSTRRTGDNSNRMSLITSSLSYPVHTSSTIIFQTIRNKNKQPKPETIGSCFVSISDRPAFSTSAVKNNIHQATIQSISRRT